MNQMEEKDLDDATLQILKFLGQVYVKLQGVLAVEEYVCEQYKASIQFLAQCLSGSCHTSSSKDFGKISSKSRNNIRQVGEQRKQSVAGRDGDTRKQEQELVVLCDYLDGVLTTAEDVRKRLNEMTLGKGQGDFQRPNFTGNLHFPNGVNHVATSGSSTLVPKAIHRMNVAPVSKTRVKNNMPNSRMPVIGSRKTGKVQRSLILGTPRVCNKKQSRKTSQVKESNENSHVPLSTRPSPIATSVPSRPKELAIKFAANSTTRRSYLQFPEKYQTLLSWFKTREDYWINTYAVSRTKAPVEDTFISLLNDVDDQQDSDNEEYKNAFLPIRELQNLMEDISSRTNKFSMLNLHRQAPTGSKIQEMRNLIVQNLMPLEVKDGHMVTKQEIDISEFIGVTNSSWLPQICWEYLSQVLTNAQLLDLSMKRLEQSLVTYYEPEQIILIARLSHCIQVIIFHQYFEEVFGRVLLRTVSTDARKDEEHDIDITGLLRCQLAHSILCKEGRALFVLAERITTSA